jgi:hypothetical protein
VRQLPSAKVCFLGGCPRSGRNQDPVGALPRSRRPPRRRALACLHPRCLRVKAAEKGVQTTAPLRWGFWVTEVETMRNVRFEFPPCVLGTAGNRFVNTLIRVGLRCRECRRKTGHVESNEPVCEATVPTSHGEWRCVQSGRTAGLSKDKALPQAMSSDDFRLSRQRILPASNTMRQCHGRCEPGIVRNADRLHHFGGLRVIT